MRVCIVLNIYSELQPTVLNLQSTLPLINTLYHKYDHNKLSITQSTLPLINTLYHKYDHNKLSITQSTLPLINTLYHKYDHNKLSITHLYCHITQ